MKISVALCTYNGEKFLREQIDSILNQTHLVHEIVVCDDCSSDTTMAIIEEYNAKHPNLFKIVSNETNLRSNKNFEKAISLTTGDYIFLSDQDDIWRNDKVEKIMEVFSKNPTAEGVFSNANFIDKKSERIFPELSLWSSVNFFESSIKSENDLYKSLINIGNFLTGATLCIKKEVRTDLFPFKTIDNFIHDEWIAYILTKRKTLFFSNEKLISYRLHSNQQLGVGEIKNLKKKFVQSQRLNNLLLGEIQSKSFSDFKYKARNYFNQIEKYHKLYTTYQEIEFLEIKEQLVLHYLESDKEMKTANPIYYFFRKLSDKKKGKRQLKNYIDNI